MPLKRSAGQGKTALKGRGIITAKASPSKQPDKVKEKAVKEKAKEKLVVDNRIDGQYFTGRVMASTPKQPYTLPEESFIQVKEKAVKEKAKEKLVADNPFDQLETDLPFPPNYMMAEFSKCETLKEKKVWLIAAAIIRQDRLMHELRKRETRPVGCDFHYQTKEEIRMMMGDLDQEA